MTQKTNKSFKDEIFCKPLKKNYTTNKTDVYHIDNIWSLGITELKDHGSEIDRGYRSVLVVFDTFSKFGWTVPLKKMLKQKQTLLKKLL